MVLKLAQHSLLGHTNRDPSQAEASRPPHLMGQDKRETAWNAVMLVADPPP